MGFRICGTLFLLLTPAVLHAICGTDLGELRYGGLPEGFKRGEIEGMATTVVKAPSAQTTAVKAYSFAQLFDQYDAAREPKWEALAAKHGLNALRKQYEIVQRALDEGADGAEAAYMERLEKNAHALWIRIQLTKAKMEDEYEHENPGAFERAFPAGMVAPYLAGPKDAGSLRHQYEQCRELAIGMNFIIAYEAQQKRLVGFPAKSKYVLVDLGTAPPPPVNKMANILERARDASRDTRIPQGYRDFLKSVVVPNVVHSGTQGGWIHYDNFLTLLEKHFITSPAQGTAGENPGPESRGRTGF